MWVGDKECRTFCVLLLRITQFTSRVLFSVVNFPEPKGKTSLYTRNPMYKILHICFASEEFD